MKKSNNKFNLVFVGSGRFGNKRDSKGEKLLYMIKELVKFSEKHLFIIEDYNKEYKYDFNLYKAIPILGFKHRYIWALIRKYIYKNFSSYITGQNIVDYFIAKKIKKLKIEDDFDTVFLSSGENRKSIIAARNRGFITIQLADSAEADYNRDLIFKEYEKLNIKLNIPKNKLWISNSTLSSNEIDYIVVSSKHAKNTFSKKYPEDKIKIIPTGVDINYFDSRPNKNYSKIKFLFLADISIVKGIHYLLQAWKELIEEKSINENRAELIVVGRWTDLTGEKFKNECLNLVNGIKSIRWETNELFKMPNIPYYHEVHVYILPGLSEGSAKTIYEAMSCGLPVVCTYESGSIVRDGKDGFIVKNKNVNELKEKILYFYTNPEKIGEMGKQAREYIENNYTWDHYSERMKNVVFNIIEDGRK